MKTEIRKELQKVYRTHWINAFMKLKYDKNLTDEENIKGFFDWVYSVYWIDVKKELSKMNACGIKSKTNACIKCHEKEFYNVDCPRCNKDFIEVSNACNTLKRMPVKDESTITGRTSKHSFNDPCPAAEDKLKLWIWWNRLTETEQEKYLEEIIKK